MSDVTKSLQSDNRRRLWDPSILTSKVLHSSAKNQLQVVHTQQERFNFFEKKLHFSNDEDVYTYITACAQTPKVPGKASFSNMDDSMQVAQTIFAMHKFEKLDD